MSFLNGANPPVRWLTRCCVVVFAALLSGTAPAGSQNTLRHTVDSVDNLELVQAMQGPAARGDYPLLIELLREHPSKLVRSGAAVFLAGFGEQTVIDALTAAMTDPEDWVRHAAVEALSYIGGPEVEAGIRRAAGDPVPEVAQVVPLALERLTPGTSIPFGIVAQGRDSQRSEPGLVTISTSETWDALWSSHRPTDVRPEVDFSRQRVLALFLGEQSEQGRTVEVREVQQKPKFLRVLIDVRDVRTESPEDRGPSARTSAYQIITVANTDLPLHLVRRFVSGSSSAAKPGEPTGDVR